MNGWEKTRKSKPMTEGGAGGGGITGEKLDCQQELQKCADVYNTNWLEQPETRRVEDVANSLFFIGQFKIRGKIKKFCQVLGHEGKNEDRTYAEGGGK